MKTNMKILGLAVLCVGYVTIVGCGGGGGASDGNGNSVSAQASCFQVPTPCANGKAADSTGKAECPYTCGNASVSVNTNSVVGTATATN